MSKILSTYSCLKKYIKGNIWRVAVRRSYIQDARFLKVKKLADLFLRCFKPFLQLHILVLVKSNNSLFACHQVPCISTLGNLLLVQTMHNKLTDINIVTQRSTGYRLPDDGLVKPKHVGAFIIYFNVNFNVFKENLLCISWSNKRLCKMAAVYCMLNSVNVLVFPHYPSCFVSVPFCQVQCLGMNITLFRETSKYLR